MSNELKYVELSRILENPVALRPVDKQDEDFISLRDSIAQKGVLKPVLVRPHEELEGHYWLVDGLQRYTAASEAGLESVPCMVKEMNQLDVLENQLVANFHRVDTKPVQYSEQLQRILALNPTESKASLAGRLGVSPAWINERLGLLRLIEGAAALVDDGKINLQNAYTLSKLPAEEQPSFVERAQTMTPQEFSHVALTRKKELDKARREGRSAEEEKFVPTPHLRKMSELKGEYETGTAAKQLVETNGVTSPVDGFALGIAWAMNLDPQSVALQQQAYDEKKRAQAERRKKAAEDRTKKKAEEAQITAARLQYIADAAASGLDSEAAAKEFDAEHGLVDGKKPKAE